VSGAISGSLSDGFRLVGLGARSLKGFAQPVEAFAVNWR
jgi:class 3 adenylate cyclase